MIVNLRRLSTGSLGLVLTAMSGRDYEQIAEVRAVLDPQKIGPVVRGKEGILILPLEHLTCVGAELAKVQSLEETSRIIRAIC